MSNLPEIGSHVRVPFGNGMVEGRVLYAYDSGFGGQVRVEVMFDGADEPFTSTYSVENVELAANR